MMCAANCGGGVIGPGEDGAEVVTSESVELASEGCVGPDEDAGDHASSNSGQAPGIEQFPYMVVSISVGIGLTTS